MRSLLIGADGQVGHELLDRLSRLGEVAATTLSGHLADGSACWPLDLGDKKTLRDMVRTSRAGLVVNAAAYTAVDRAESERDLAFAVNATAPAIVADECARRNVSLVHFSTDYVFPGSGDRALREDDPTGPASVYGASKLAGEEAVRAAGGPHKIFRLCWLYGPRGRNFLLTMLRLAAEREELRVVADQYGCPTPAAWIADVVTKAVESKPDLSGTWHVAASGRASWHAFAQAIIDEAGSAGLLARRPAVVPISTADYPTPAKRPAYSVLDCARLERDFGIRLPEWGQGVVEVVGEVVRNR